MPVCEICFQDLSGNWFQFCLQEESEANLAKAHTGKGRGRGRGRAGGNGRKAGAKAKAKAKATAETKCKQNGKASKNLKNSEASEQTVKPDDEASKL